MTADSSRKRSLEEPACARRAEQFGEPTATQAVADVGAHFAEIREQFGHFIQAQADMFRFKLRRAAIIVALTFAALVAVVSSIATVVVLLITGIAGGISELVGDRVWLGNAITALVVFATAAFMVHSKLARSKASRLRELVEKYERRKMRQRTSSMQKPGESESRS